MQGSMSSGMAGAKKSTLIFFNVLFHVNVSGFAGAKKGRGIQTTHPKKNCFFALFHVDVPGVFGAKRGN